MILHIEDNGSLAVTRVTKTRNGKLNVYAACGWDAEEFIEFLTGMFPKECVVVSTRKGHWSSGGSAYSGGSIGVAVQFTFASLEQRKWAVAALEKVSSNQWAAKQV